MKRLLESIPVVARIRLDTRVVITHGINIYKEQATKGSIPDHIKPAVFQRDGGARQQCGYKGPYIEYDHIHPRSKGGQNTVENIQFLCRMCNLKKGARI